MLDDIQREAIARSSSIERIVAVTGAAGTGKTTIIKESYHELTELGYKVVLCAPTGKAAKRITEATGIPAMTIHRLLEYTHPRAITKESTEAYKENKMQVQRLADTITRMGKDVTNDIAEEHRRLSEEVSYYEEAKRRGGYGSYPRRDRQRPIEFDCVIADEFAMVNWELYTNLRDAIPPGGLLRVFGDANQLPPIEKDRRVAEQHGNTTPFIMLVQKFNGIVLSKVYRQGEGSGIVVNASRILRGSIPIPLDGLSRAVTERPLEMLEDYVKTQHRKGIDYSGLDNQIITPVKRGWTGTRAVNALMQNIFRQEDMGWVELPRYADEETEEEPVRVHAGDKVLVTRNNYFVRSNEAEVGVFNGEVGIVVEANDGTGMVRVDFGDRICDFPPDLTIMDSKGKMKTIDPRKDLDLAYCVTTHKAQGSEYKHVIYVLNTSTGRLRTRSNFYTAVTRARLHCHIIADQKSLGYAVYNNKQLN